MTFQGFKNNKVVKILTNLYVIIFIPFLIWMLFFDENSYLIHRKFDNEVQDLERTISFYKKKKKAPVFAPSCVTPVGSEGHKNTLQSVVP